MPSLARIVGEHPKKGYWVYVIRKSPSAVFGVILDGKGVADSEGRQIEKDLVDGQYNCLDKALDLNKSSFRHFPVRIYGKVTPQNPSGDFDIFSLTGDPTAVQRLPNTAIPTGTTPKSSYGDNTTQLTVTTTLPIQVAPAPPKPVVHTSKKMVMPTVSGVIKASPDGTPIVTIDRIIALLDSMPVEQSYMIWGPAGVGKSAVVNQFANARNLIMFDVRLSGIDPTVLQGIGVPDLIKMKCVWLPNEFIPTEPNSILFLDELTTAPQTIQALAYQITLDRAIGSQPLPEDCRIICAGNRITDRGVAFTMPSPLSNRLLHVTVEADIASWRRWALSAGIDSRLISFLSVQTTLLHAMDASNSGGAWPSPRSWAACNRVLNSHLTPAEMGVGIAGCVGVPAAKEFIKYCGEFEKYTKKVMGILDGVEKNYVENDASRAITVAVAVVANATDDIGTLVNVVEWAKKQNEEYTAIVVRGLEERFGEDKINELGEVDAGLASTIKSVAAVGGSLPF